MKVLFDWLLNYSSIFSSWAGDTATEFPVRVGNKYYFYSSGNNSDIIPRLPLEWYRPRLCIRITFSFDRTYGGQTFRQSATAFAPGLYMDFRNNATDSIQNTMYQSSTIIFDISGERLETSGYVNGFKITSATVSYTPGAAWTGGGTLDNVTIDEIKAVGYMGILNQNGFFWLVLPSQFIPFVTVPTSEQITALFVEGV